MYPTYPIIGDYVSMNIIEIYVVSNICFSSVQCNFRAIFIKIFIKKEKKKKRMNRTANIELKLCFKNYFLN